MKIIKPNVQIIDDQNPFIKIEKAARTCYKSEANITSDSAIKMYDRLVNSNHTAMLEHATFVFTVSSRVYADCLEAKYLNCTETKWFTSVHCPAVVRCLVSGNLRAINESGIVELLDALYLVDKRYVYAEGYKSDHNDDLDKYREAKLIDFENNIQNKTSEEIEAHRYTTMKFITDRGVTHEIVRHREFSFAQESTRYVNYNKDKFGGGNINFIEPYEFDKWTPDMQGYFCNTCYKCEEGYNDMIKAGATPQQARAILPNAIKTEIIVTGNDKEWGHFFNLRSRGTTGAPHPDMKRVADMALVLYNHKWGYDDPSLEEDGIECDEDKKINKEPEQMKIV